MRDDHEGKEQLEQAVQEYMSKNDPSHDFLHVRRVVKNAFDIATTLPVPPDMDVIIAAALLHDVDDDKLSQYNTAVFEPDLSYLSLEQAQLAKRIAANVSYSKEVKRLAAGEDTDWHRTCLELHCVQDADKLDAIGAVGIMRCAAYSAVTSRALTDAGEDQSGGSTAIAHFYDKLLKLKDMMKTPRGQQLAESRHDFMLTFLKQLKLETEPSFD